MKETTIEHTISSMLRNCENAQSKFVKGSSQHSLLVHRIEALHIAEALIKEEDVNARFTKEQQRNALPRLMSIYRKCEKAHAHQKESSQSAKRLQKQMDVMYMAISALKEIL